MRDFREGSPRHGQYFGRQEAERSRRNGAAKGICNIIQEAGDSPDGRKCGRFPEADRTAGGIDTYPVQVSGPSRPPTGKGSCLCGRPHEMEHAQAAADGTKSRVERPERASPKQCNAGGKCQAETRETCRTAGTPTQHLREACLSAIRKADKNPPDLQMRNRHMHLQMPRIQATDGRKVTGKAVVNWQVRSTCL